MKRWLLAVAVVVGLLGAWSIGRLQGQDQNDNVLFVASKDAHFTEVPNTNGKVSSAVIWGDPSSGAHASFTKFAPGYDAGMHTHTNEMTLVVIKGAYLYRDEAGEKRVSAGDFIRIPGGHKHWSGGDKRLGALFYQTSPGRFDLVPAK